MYPHRIHLRGPWECKPLAHIVQHADGRRETLDLPLPPTRRITIPCRWTDFAGRMLFSRRFHWPGTLDYYERLWLVFDGADYYADVWLNGEFLGRHEGAFDPFEVEITRWVRPQNELTVEVELPALAADAKDRQWMLRGSSACAERAGGLWGDVALEVRRESFLKDIRLWARFENNVPMLHVAGEVISDDCRHLELYMSLDAANVLYEKVASSPGGERFLFSVAAPGVSLWQPSPSASPALHSAWIELVDVASKVHVLHRPFGFRQLSVDQAGQPWVNGQKISPQTTDLLRPLTDSSFFDRADEQGQVFRLRLPLGGGFAPERSVRQEAVRQASAIASHLQHHPSIIGWICHTDPAAHDAELDSAIRQTLQLLDSTRPFV